MAKDENTSADSGPGVPCQLEAFPAELQSGPPTREEPWSWYLRRRGRGLVRKVVSRVRASLDRAGRSEAAVPSLGRPLFAPALQEGDRVRVRPAEYVRSTLDANGRYRGCAFAKAMYQYCGVELRVIRRVERFFDEKSWRMLRARNMVLLEGTLCDGSSLRDTGGCDRMCHFFWRTEWLEKVE